MNFTCTSTLAFADVPDKDRPSASTLAAMAQQCAAVFGVAAAAFALGLSQSLSGAHISHWRTFTTVCSPRQH